MKTNFVLKEYEDYKKMANSQRALSKIGVYRTVSQRNEEILKFAHLTLQEIGEKFGLTRERVRQIFARYGVKKDDCRPVAIIEVRKCPRCAKKFKASEKSPRKYCSLWCADHRSLNMQGKKKCHFCNKFYDLDDMTSRNRCRGCNNNYQKNLYLKNPKYFRQAVDKYARENPEKRRAWMTLNTALAEGRVTKTGCEVCGAEKVHGHHGDYTKPLEVRWLCPLHHKWHHRLLASKKK